MHELLPSVDAELYYKAGLPTDTTTQVKLLTRDEFADLFSCDYTESIVINYNGKTPLTEADFEQSQQLRRLYDRLQHPINDLIICSMGEELGCGLFTQKAISRGTIVGYYAGEIGSGSDYSDYGIYCRDLEIDSMHYGGLSRFMQHLPASSQGYSDYVESMLHDAELLALDRNITVEEANRLLASDDEKLKIRDLNRTLLKVHNDGNTFDHDLIGSPELRQNAADANVELNNIIVDGIPIIMFIAMRDIAPNEIVRFSYGDHYWRNRYRQPTLFTREGNQLSQSCEHADALRGFC